MMYKECCACIKRSYNKYLKLYSQHKNAKILEKCPICHKHYMFRSENGKIFGFSFYSYMHDRQVCAKCGLDDYLFDGKMKLICNEIRMDKNICFKMDKDIYFNFFKNVGNGNNLVKKACVFLVGA